MEPFVSRSHLSSEADGREACVYMQSRRAGQFEQMPSKQASTVLRGATFAFHRICSILTKFNALHGRSCIHKLHNSAAAPLL